MFCVSTHIWWQSIKYQLSADTTVREKSKVSPNLEHSLCNEIFVFMHTSIVLYLYLLSSSLSKSDAEQRIESHSALWQESSHALCSPCHGLLLVYAVHIFQHRLRKRNLVNNICTQRTREDYTSRKETLEWSFEFSFRFFMLHAFLFVAKVFRVYFCTVMFCFFDCLCFATCWIKFCDESMDTL